MTVATVSIRICRSWCMRSRTRVPLAVRTRDLSSSKSMSRAHAAPGRFGPHDRHYLDSRPGRIRSATVPTGGVLKYMRAVLLHPPGGIEGLRLEEVAPPRPRPGHVLVRVHAAAITPPALGMAGSGSGGASSS